MELASFLRDGVLGSLRFGMTPEEVRSVLGEASAASAPRARPLLLRYGPLELAFGKGLEMISFHLGDDSLMPPKIGGLDISRDERSLTGFTSLLQREQIPHAVDPTLTFGDQLALKLGDGTWAIFDQPTDTLVSIQSTAPEPGQRSRK